MYPKRAPRPDTPPARNMQRRARRRYDYPSDLRFQARDLVLQLHRLEEVRPALDQGADHFALVRRQLAFPDRCEDVPECFGAFAWVGQRSRLEIDRDTLADRHGPIDEEGQRRSVFSFVPASNRAVKMRGVFRRVGDRSAHAPSLSV